MNIGVRSAEQLKTVGIQDTYDFYKIGVIDTYMRVKSAYPDQVSLNMLYAVQGAKLGIPWNEISDDMKADLLDQIQATKE